MTRADLAATLIGTLAGIWVGRQLAQRFPAWITAEADRAELRCIDEVTG